MVQNNISKRYLTIHLKIFWFSMNANQPMFILKMSSEYIKTLSLN